MEYGIGGKECEGWEALKYLRYTKALNDRTVKKRIGKDFRIQIATSTYQIVHSTYQ